MSAELIYVSINNGDAALFVNGTPVYTQEAIDKGEPVCSVAESLASAMQVGLQRTLMEVPSDSDWGWTDVYELLRPAHAVAHDEKREVARPFNGPSCLDTENARLLAVPLFDQQPL